MKYKINETFNNFLPPLSDEEYAELEKSVLAHGILDPLKTWKGFIIDGHHRHLLSEKYDLEIPIPPVTMDDQLENEDDVKVWMIDNQKGRRNLNDIELADLYKIKYEILKKKGEDKMTEAGKEGGKIAGKGRPKKDDNRGLPSSDKPLNTHEEIAKELGWGKTKTGKALYITNHATDKEMAVFKKEKCKIGTAHKIVKDRIDAEKEASKPKPPPTEEEIYAIAINKILKDIDKIIKSADTLHNKIVAVNMSMDDLHITQMDNGIDTALSIGSFSRLFQAFSRMLHRFGIDETQIETKKIEDYDQDNAE